jgi:hypothetical protein
MTEARPAISFALPLDREKIRSYLSKRDHAGHGTNNIEVNIRSSRLSKALANWLEEKGFPSRRIHSNLVYRTEVEGELFKTLIRAAASYQRWPERKGDSKSYANPAYQGADLRIACGNCQVVCRGDEEETRVNYRLLTSSGCVIQREDGSVKVLPPEEADRALERLGTAHRELYR